MKLGAGDETSYQAEDWVTFDTSLITSDQRSLYAPFIYGMARKADVAYTRCAPTSTTGEVQFENLEDGDYLVYAEDFVSGTGENTYAIPTILTVTDGEAGQAALKSAHVALNETVTVRGEASFAAGHKKKDVVFDLLADGEVINSVTAGASEGYAHEWTGLDAGREYVVIVSPGSGVIPERVKTQNGVTTYAYAITTDAEEKPPVNPPKETVIVAAKAVFAEGTKKHDITFELLSDGELIDTATVGEAQGYKHEWTGLSAGHKYVVLASGTEGAKLGKIDSDGNRTEFVYDVETEPEDPKPENVTVGAKAVFAEGHETMPVVFELLADGEHIENVTVTKANDWTYTWKNLDGSKSYVVVVRDLEGSALGEIKRDGNETQFVYTVDTPELPTEPATDPTEPSSEDPTEPSSEDPTEPSSEDPTEPSSEDPIDHNNTVKPTGPSKEPVKKPDRELPSTGLNTRMVLTGVGVAAGLVLIGGVLYVVTTKKKVK